MTRKHPEFVWEEFYKLETIQDAAKAFFELCSSKQSHVSKYGGRIQVKIEYLGKEISFFETEI